MAGAPNVDHAVIVDAVSLSVDESFVIDRCGGCGMRIALRSPTPNSPASTWRCRGCGTLFFARPQQVAGQAFSAGTRAESYYSVMRDQTGAMAECAGNLSEAELQSLVELLSSPKGNGPTARRHERHAVSTPVTVMPLSGDLRIIGPTERSVLVNVSNGGAALLHARTINAPFLAIDFTAVKADLLAVVLKKTRVRPVASSFEIAGEFLSRIMV